MPCSTGICRSNIPGHLKVDWAPHVRNTENNVALMVGDGLWGTISALGSYDLRFADPVTGQVAYFGTVSETQETAAFTCG